MLNAKLSDLPSGISDRFFLSPSRIASTMAEIMVLTK